MNTCSGVTRALTSYFTSHKRNLFWMCDKCADLFSNSHFRVVASKADELSPLNSLTMAITELRTEIKQLNSKPAVQLTPATGNVWPPIEQRRGNKRARELEVRTNSQMGSKQTAAENVLTVPTSGDPMGLKFWLYLSRIRPDATNDAVSALVKDSLEMDVNPEVVKLVPKDKDTSTLSFISFKIGLDPSLQAKALDSTTWPEGLLFREFEDYGLPKFRMPLKSKKPITPLLQIPVTSSPVTPVMDLR